MPISPPPKLCPKIILEGTRLTHKTDIAFALNEHPRIVGARKYRYHSPIISAEWCGFTNFPWGRSLINFNPEEEQKAMEVYRTWAHLFTLQKYYSWIVDRFHVSTIAHQASLGRIYDFAWLEKQLLPLQFCIIHCTRTDESFHRAREERLLVSGNPKQYDDLDSFKKEQRHIRSIVADSLLPNFEVDVSDGNIERVCEEIAILLEEQHLLGYDAE